MKRLINLILILVFCSSIVFAQSTVNTLEAGKSKEIVFGSKTFVVTVTNINMGISATFDLGDESVLIPLGDSFTFKDGTSISIIDFLELQSSTQPNRVKFLFEAPTFRCDTTRCFNWQTCEVDTCVDKPVCGNNLCEDSEHCGNCVEDCACEDGYKCEVENCVLEPKYIVDDQEEPVFEEVDDQISEELPSIKEIGFFRSIWNWFISLF